jgi:hypothetical protein
VALPNFNGNSLPPKNPENKGEDQADDDACGEGKVEGEGVLLHVDVAGKTADVGNPRDKKEDKADCEDDDSEDYEHPAESGHMRIP